MLHGVDRGFSQGIFAEARLEHAKDLLRAGEQSISEISEAVGYYSQFQFSRDFKKEYGLTPSDYRGGGEVPRAKKGR